MKRLILSGVLAASTLWFSAPAKASVPPPLPTASQSFSAGSMHVDVYGTAGKPAMIFIPGLTCGPWEWSREIALFSPEYRIYALTLPGFDGQAAVQTPLLQTVSSDFWSMLQTRGIEKPLIIGHSLGGTLAIELAEQHADRIGAIVAVDGLPVFPGMENLTDAQRRSAGERMAAMLGAATTHEQFEFAEKMYALPALMTSPDDIAAVAPLVARSDPKASGAWAAADVAADLRPALKNVTVPFLEIAPYEASPRSPVQTAQAMQAYYASLIAGAPHAQVQVIEDSRHFVMYDQPQRLDAALSAFVKTLK